MRRLIALLVAAGMASLGSLAATGPAQAKAPGPNGRIAFARQATPVGIPDQGHVTSTVNPDGSHIEQLPGLADFPKWSPDGTEISIDDADCMFEGLCAAVIFDVDTSTSRVLPNPAPTLLSGIFCDTWSPDGTRLACGGRGDTPGVSGVYTIRSSDGGGLTQVLTCDECGPTDYSPDGTRLLLMGPDHHGRTSLFVVYLDGSGFRRVTPPGTPVDGDNGASWSPTGDQILFGGNADDEHRRSIFVINADGSDLHQVPIPGCGGSFSDARSIGCFGPGWSPDGTKIVFVRARTRFISVQNIYTANADGSGLFQVTHHRTGLELTTPDWGSHPLAP
jgi:Tol biopolymer transport system component